MSKKVKEMNNQWFLLKNLHQKNKLVYLQEYLDWHLYLVYPKIDTGKESSYWQAIAIKYFDWLECPNIVKWQAEDLLDESNSLFILEAGLDKKLVQTEFESLPALQNVLVNKIDSFISEFQKMDSYQQVKETIAQLNVTLNYHMK